MFDMQRINLEYPKKSKVYKIKPVGGTIPIFKLHYIPEFIISRDELKKRFVICKTELGFNECEICNLSKYLIETGYCYKLRETLKQMNVIRNDKQFDFTPQYMMFLPVYEFDYRFNDYVFKFLVLNESLAFQFYDFIEQNQLFEVGDILKNKQAIEMKISDKSIFYFDYITLIDNIDLQFPKPLIKTQIELEQDKQLIEDFRNLNFQNIQNPEILPFEFDVNILTVISQLLQKRITTAINKLNNS
jgi:hypothetical protein